MEKFLLALPLALVFTHAQGISEADLISQYKDSTRKASQGIAATKTALKSNNKTALKTAGSLLSHLDDEIVTFHADVFNKNKDIIKDEKVRTEMAQTLERLEDEILQLQPQTVSVSHF